MIGADVRARRSRRLAAQVAAARAISDARRGSPDAGPWPNETGMRGAAARLQRSKKGQSGTTWGGTSTWGFHFVCYAALNRRVNPETVTRRLSFNRRSTV